MQMKEKICLTGLLLGVNLGCITASPNQCASKQWRHPVLYLQNKYLWGLTFVTLTSIRIDTEGCSLQRLAFDKLFHMPISFLPTAKTSHIVQD
jgi:hypothetical protein